jgi:hypothetical protein
MGESYSVVRSDGRIEDKWTMGAVGHFNDVCALPAWVKASVTESYPDSRGKRSLKYFMHNNYIEGRKHSCGWRSNYVGRRGFWPTRLTTRKEQEEWWVWLDEQVETLKAPEQRRMVSFLDKWLP